MDDNGYIYVLMNPSMPNLVKIGKTTRNSEERAKELSSTTGVPTPFVVAYDDYFKSCSEAELHIHSTLEHQGYRVSISREFFEIPIKDAIDAVVKAKKYFGEFNQNDSESNFEDDENTEPWLDILAIAENYYYGMGDYIQDYHDAIKYYLKAIKLGYKQGYYDIAMIYELDLEDQKKSFEYYKKGIDHGCIECYSGIGQYYSYKDVHKAQKSYELYMKNQPEEDLTYINICQYLMLSIRTIAIDGEQKDIKYFEKTLQYKDEILKYFSEYNNRFLMHNYNSFYDLPKPIQEDMIIEYEKHNSTGYITASFSATFHLGKDFLDYLKLIYLKDYIPPNDFDGFLFENEFLEI